MSNDEMITQQLIKALEDGYQGYQKAADKLRADGQGKLAETLRKYAHQRAGFATELKSMASSYGDLVDQSGTLAGAVHRGWMTLKDAASGSSPAGVLDVAAKGEKHAVDEFQKALDSDLSPGLRTVVERQFAEVQAAHSAVSAMHITD